MTDDFEFTDATDNEIFMHREVHFGSQFEAMIEYYESDGIGMQREFSVSRMRVLDRLEKEAKENIAPQLLSGAEAEKVARARKAYKGFQEIYEKENLKSKLPVLIADLLLTELEDPKDELQAVIDAGSQIVPFLIDLIRSEEFYDPLFPGYGRAPYFAAECLGQIGDETALAALFEALGHGEFFDEDRIIQAIAKIGQPARDFVLQVLKSRPLNKDNETAAMILSSFKEDEVVSKVCLEQLQDPEVKKNPTLCTYLIYGCEALNKEDQEKFANLQTDPKIHEMLKVDIKHLVQEWSR